MSTNVSIQTDPPGADIFLKEYKSSGEDWKKVGTSPLQNLRVPKGYFRWKISKTGFRTILAVAPIGFWQTEVHLSYSLQEYNKIPPGMARIPGLKSDPESGPGNETMPVKEDFWMDEYEVSNKDFKKFVDSGGYRNRKYWKVPFVKDGRELSFEEAMNYFRDATGGSPEISGLTACKPLITSPTVPRRRSLSIFAAGLFGSFTISLIVFSNLESEHFCLLARR